MLGVTKRTEHALALFRLSLELARNREDVPQPYRAHVEAVLQQARDIVAKGRAVNAQTLPEAIDLAAAMTLLQTLREQVEAIESFERIDPAIATKLLEAMEQRAAHSH
jgi:alpha-D-ribose 1-methylphosphonate 5-triphosphate synthase subunit PhnI